MKQRSRKALSWLLTLALVLGLLPALGGTARADGTVTWNSSVINSINLYDNGANVTHDGITVTLNTES